MENIEKHTIQVFLDIYKSFDIAYTEKEKYVCCGGTRFTTRKRFHIACNIGMRNIYHLFPTA